MKDAVLGLFTAKESEDNDSGTLEVVPAASRIPTEARNLLYKPLRPPCRSPTKPLLSATDDAGGSVNSLKAVRVSDWQAARCAWLRESLTDFCSAWVLKDAREPAREWPSGRKVDDADGLDVPGALVDAMMDLSKAET
jgi:hypothetical protein